MRTVTEGLVLGGAATAQRGPHPDWRSLKQDWRAHSKRAIFANIDEVHAWGRFVRAAVVARILNSAGRAIMSDSDGGLHAVRVGGDPGANYFAL